MKSWAPMMIAGLAALIGGLLALINPTGAAVTTLTLVSWALLVVAGLQGYAAYKSVENGAKIRAGAIAAVALILALVLFFGNPAESWLIRLFVALILIGSGAVKIYASRAMAGEQHAMLVVGCGGVSVVLGIVVLMGLNLNFGILLGIELLATGLGLVLLAMHRRANGIT